MHFLKRLLLVLAFTAISTQIKTIENYESSTTKQAIKNILEWYGFRYNGTIKKYESSPDEDYFVDSTLFGNKVSLAIDSNGTISETKNARKIPFQLNNYPHFTNTNSIFTKPRHSVVKSAPAGLLIFGEHLLPGHNATSFKGKLGHALLSATVRTGAILWYSLNYAPGKLDAAHALGTITIDTAMQLIGNSNYTARMQKYITASRIWRSSPPLMRNILSNGFNYARNVTTWLAVRSIMKNAGYDVVFRGVTPPKFKYYKFGSL